MRLSKQRIRHMAESLAARLEQEGHVVVGTARTSFVETLDHAITEELSVEDRLNAEVRRLLQAHESDIERGHVDYQKMFLLLKQKLVRERGIIL